MDILIREHDCNSKDDSTFYNILHALYASVLGSEMTPFGFVKIFTDCEKAIYTDNKFIFNVYAQYRSITDWISLFEQYGFESLDSYGDPGIFAHGFYDQQSDTYFVDQMDSFTSCSRLKNNLTLNKKVDYRHFICNYNLIHLIINQRYILLLLLSTLILI